MFRFEFNVEGIMCEHCCARLEKVLTGTEGVINASVSLETKTATVEAESDIKQKITEAIEDAGFTVKA